MFAAKSDEMLSSKWSKFFPIRWQLRMLSSAVQDKKACLALVYSKFGQPENVVRYVAIILCMCAE